MLWDRNPRFHLRRESSERGICECGPRHSAETGILKEVGEKGTYIKEKGSGFHSPAVKNVRGMGLMLGIIVDPEKRAGYVAKLMEQGVLVLTAGTDAIRLLPPLVITYEEIDQHLRP